MFIFPACFHVRTHKYQPLTGTMKEIILQIVLPNILNGIVKTCTQLHPSSLFGFQVQSS